MVHNNKLITNATPAAIAVALVVDISFIFVSLRVDYVRALKPKRLELSILKTTEIRQVLSLHIPEVKSQN